MSDNPFVGRWTYRSLLNDPDVNTGFGDLEFGRGEIVIAEAPQQILKGTIGGPGWSLTLQGSRAYGSPMQMRCQGVGTVGGERWVYAYEGALVPPWPDGVAQRPAMVGSVIRVVPHSGGSPGTVAPAGVVASFYAVRAD